MQASRRTKLPAAPHPPASEREAAREAAILRNMNAYRYVVDGVAYSTEAQATWDTTGAEDGWYTSDLFRATFARMVASGRIARVDIDCLRSAGGDYLFRLS